MWNGTWEKEKTRKVFMEEMIFEPISYWFGRIKTQMEEGLFEQMEYYVYFLT